MGKSTTKKQKLKLNYFKPLLFLKLILNAPSILEVYMLLTSKVIKIFHVALETYRTIHLIFVELEKIRIPLNREDQFSIHGLNVQHDIHSTVLSDEKHQFMD